MLFTQFYLSFMPVKKWKPSLHTQQTGSILALNPQLFCQQIDKKHPLVK